MALSKTTQDHEEIRQWAEARGGKPAEVTSTSADGTGILRIEFPGAPGAQDSNLNEISWEEFFEKFDASGLSLVYQEVTSEGAESNFNKLIHAEEPAGTPAKTTTRAKKASAKQATPAKKSAAKSGPAKKSSAKSAPLPANGRKSATKKSSATKKAASKSAAKAAPTTAGRRAGSKKSAVKKATAKKASAKKAPSKKAVTKKAPSKKVAARTTPAKKTSAKRTSAKKTTRAGAQRAAIAIKKKGGPKKGR